MTLKNENKNVLTIAVVSSAQGNKLFTNILSFKLKSRLLLLINTSLQYVYFNYILKIQLIAVPIFTTN